MTNYIIYNTNGDILRTGVCPTDLLNSQAGVGEFVMEGVASDTKHVIVNGSIQDKSLDLVAIKAEVQEHFRIMRTSRLSMCDWTQTADCPLNASDVALWATYRQALRDLPATYNDILSISEVVWPTPPS